MELELITENRFARSWYDRENRILRSEYQGVVSVELAQQNFQGVLDKLEQHPLRAAIFNCLEMRGTFTQLNPWLNSVWYPALIPQGYRCWSMATTDVFTRFAGNMLINKLTPREIRAAIFGSMDKAEDWVEEYLHKKVLV